MTALLDESRGIRNVARFLTVFYGAWLIFLVLVAITGIGLSRDIHLSTSGHVFAVIGVIVIYGGFGLVAGGWKALQIVTGRGRAVADAWTMGWLGLFAIISVAGPIQLAMQRGGSL
jgi:hypothetical protein